MGVANAGGGVEMEEWPTEIKEWSEEPRKKECLDLEGMINETIEIYSK
jgi:hypothetical protein